MFIRRRSQAKYDVAAAAAIGGIRNPGTHGLLRFTTSPRIGWTVTMSLCGDIKIGRSANFQISSWQRFEDIGLI